MSWHITPPIFAVQLAVLRGPCLNGTTQHSATVAVHLLAERSSAISGGRQLPAAHKLHSEIYGGVRKRQILRAFVNGVLVHEERRWALHHLRFAGLERGEHHLAVHLVSSEGDDLAATSSTMLSCSGEACSPAVPDEGQERLTSAGPVAIEVSVEGTPYTFSRELFPAMREIEQQSFDREHVNPLRSGQPLNLESLSDLLLCSIPLEGPSKAF